MGRVFKYGDNVDTDSIIPARYLNTADAGELACHCMEDIDGDFAERVNPGDIIVGGRNFGCGSSREHAPAAIKACGVSCVIAHSFGRIFFRNAINTGLAIFECPEAAQEFSAGDEAMADIKAGIIKNLTTGKEYKAAPYEGHVLGIIEAGGLMEYCKEGGYDT